MLSVALLAVTQGRCLPAICDARDAHAQGLQSSVWPLRGLVPAWVSRRLMQLDVAFAVNRHTTKASCDSLVAGVQVAPGDIDAPRVPEGFQGDALLLDVPLEGDHVVVFRQDIRAACRIAILGDALVLADPPGSGSGSGA